MVYYCYCQDGKKAEITIDHDIEVEMNPSSHCCLLCFAIIKLLIDRSKNTSLRASSPTRSGRGAGKGRRACDYVSGI